VRVLLFATIALGPVLAASCSRPAGGGGTVGTLRSPIAYGTLDTTHAAVVAVLAPITSTELQQCTGSVVLVSGGNGYVLTAAHCCNTYVPTVIVAANSYAAGEQYLGGGVPQPPSYAVVSGSVYYDTLYSQDMGLDHDFCMLKFSGAPANMATLALPPPSGDGLELGSPVDHIGYGLTQNGANTQRMSGIDTINLELTPLVVAFGQGGPDATPGTCEGDSGGPSLFPALSPASQQVVVAVQSYGNATSCADATFGVASRVSSATGTGGFITSYLAGAPIGTQAGAPPDGGAAAR
jgi:hypothetical protein